MIAACEPQEFVPFGRQHMKRHPGPLTLTKKKSGDPLVYTLAQKLSKVNINDNPQHESWILTDCSAKANETREPGEHRLVKEKELYVTGKTAVVSTGSVGVSVAQGFVEKSSCRRIEASYTVENRIQHALFCNFLDFDSKPIPSLSLIQSERINVFCDNGSDFTTPLQFKVAAAWATKYGLLLERVSHTHAERSNDSSCNCEELTTLFSLVHPLDEISPFLCSKTGGSLTYMNDSSYKVVHTSEEPSICLLFNVKTGLHSIWRIRWAEQEECEGMCGLSSLSLLRTTRGTSSTSKCLRPSASFKPASENNSTLNKTAGLGFSYGPEAFSANPLQKTHYVSATSTRPQVNTNTAGRIHTASSEARLGLSAASQADPKPIIPELCLEYLWTESSHPAVNLNSKFLPASKAFITTDFLGQQYLCYLIGGTSLAMVKLGKTNSLNPEMIVGSVSNITAQDAIPIPALNLMAVLESGGLVILYSGTTVVGKLHIGGVSAERATVSYLISLSSVSRINSPFPQTHTSGRSSLLSSTRIGEGAFEESLLLSPVPRGLDVDLLQAASSPCSPSPDLVNPVAVGPIPDHETIKRLRDPVGSKLTVEFANGALFRMSMPELCSSPLVTSCVKVFERVLQRDVAFMILAKWYTTRNAPGTQDISPRQEWQLFISTILGLMGYDINSLPLMKYYINSECDTSVRGVKKMKSCDTGSNEDWDFISSKDLDGYMPPHVKGIFSSDRLRNSTKQTTGEVVKDKIAFKKEAPLFSKMYWILLPLHLLYEEMKLDPILSDLWMLAQFLYQLSIDLRLTEFAHHYWTDFPVECTFATSSESQLTENDLVNLEVPHRMDVHPCSLFDAIIHLCTSEHVKTLYPYMNGVNDKSKKILQIFGTLTGHELENIIKNVLPISGARQADSKVVESNCLSPSRAHQAVLLMANLGFTRKSLLNLPFGVGLILASAIQTVTESPCQGWPLEVCQLICRLDLSPDTSKSIRDERVAINRCMGNQGTEDSCAKISDAILKMRFNKDQRVQEVKRLLKSSEPAVIDITQRPEVNDHEFIEEQERHLYAICIRTMALPVGRGMMDLHTAISVIITEQLEIPKLCLTGKAPPRGTTVELTHIEVVPNMNLWPLFHNGVAAGLQISPHSKNIDSPWILYNKPKANGTDVVPEHAGFLMALGLSGHLNDLMQLHLYNYLNKCHEMTSVGVLLGLAASKRGTMDSLATKIFSLHIESLLPPTSIELDLVQNTQVAAMLGIGLIYQGTAHRHIAQALLSEIGRPPGPEMENSCDREGYSLAAGLGLGLVMLQKGSDPIGLADHDIADTLHHYMVGGHRRPLTGSQKEKYKNPSYQIREGECVNYHVTGPGATLALGMMYFNSKNIAVASWLKAPESEYMMDFVCPHQLMLRTISHGLVLWDMIIPSRDWVESHIPPSLKPYCLTRPRPGLENVDLETMNQAYCNIVAGACMVLGLRFAGTSNNQAFETLYYYCKFFISLATKSIAELAGKSTIETCICVTLLALATTMAGSGDLGVLRICRYLGSRVGQATNSVVTYGSHLVVHMALGLLFLGGGALSLSNSPESAAAMICAFFPRFPTHSNDNRYHLQAFRHLYVLAVEPRLFLPKDISQGRLCYTHLSVEFLKSPYYGNTTITMFAPCILPHLDLLKEVRIEDDRYWPISFSRGNNWPILEEILKKGGTIGIELRAGRLPYDEDPRGFKTLLAQTLSQDAIVSWTVSTPTILAFLANKNTISFAKTFLVQSDGYKRSKKLVHWLSNVAYECITRNKLPLLEYWTLALAEMMKLERSPSTALITQLKLIVACKHLYLHSDRVAAISQLITSVLESWETSHHQLLKDYITGTMTADQPEPEALMLAAYLAYWSIPSPGRLKFISDGSSKTFLEAILKAKRSDVRMPSNLVKFCWSLVTDDRVESFNVSDSTEVLSSAEGPFVSASLDATTATLASVDDS